MNRSIFFCTIAAMFMFGATSKAKTNLKDYKRVLVFRSSHFDPQSGLSVNSPPVNGYLAAIVQDTLHVLTTSGEEAICRTDITRVIVRGEPRAGEGLGYGMLIGGYAGLYFLGSEGNNGTFLHNNISDAPWVILLGLLPGFAIGAGVGYLVDPGSDGKDELFDLTANADPGQTGWHRLMEKLKPQGRENKFHISIQGSHLYNFNFGDPFMNDYGSSDVSSFNLLRKLQCTYSNSPQLELGVALTPFGSHRMNRYGYTSLTPTTYRSTYMEKNLSATGYYFVAQYNPLNQGNPERFDLHIGGGVGLMSSDYRRDITSTAYDYSNQTSQNLGPFYYANSQSALSGMIYSEISMQLYDGLTLGVVLDRIIVEGLDDPGEQSIGYAPSTLNLGTWSFGITIGAHF